MLISVKMTGARRGRKGRSSKQPAGHEIHREQNRKAPAERATHDAAPSLDAVRLRPLQWLVHSASRVLLGTAANPPTLARRSAAARCDRGECNMTKLANIAGAALLAFAFSTAAGAAPIPPTGATVLGGADSSSIVEARWHGHHYGWGHGHHYGWSRGHHYGWGRGHHYGWRHYRHWY